MKTLDILKVFLIIKKHHFRKNVHYFGRLCYLIDIIDIDVLYYLRIVKTQPHINLTEFRLRLDISVKPNPPHPPYTSVESRILSVMLI